MDNPDFDTSVRPPDEVAEALEAIEAFRQAGFDLFPIRPRSKVPRDKGWQHKDYNDFDWREWLRIGGNAAVRLGSGDLVLDVDPRNFKPGDADPLNRLSMVLGAALDYAPTTITGAGGKHIYHRLPEGVRVVPELKGRFDGIEYKSVGRFVLAPGSIHPDTGEVYKVDERVPSIDMVEQAPDALVKLIRRPVRPERVEGSGELEPETLARLLGVLDPRKYGGGKYDEWIKLAAACHDATGGAGLDVFAQWCARDPAYGDAFESIERHWESFTAGRPDGVTARTLYAAVSSAGHSKLVGEILGEAEREAALEMLDAEPLEEPKSGERRVAGLQFTLGKDIEMEHISWCWPNRLARGKVNSLSGDPGLSKTTFLMTIAAIITRGGEWPDGSGRAEQGYVIIMSAEDDAADTLLPRFVAAGGDPAYLIVVEPSVKPKKESPRQFSVAEDMPRLERIIREFEPKLVGLDPIGAMLGSSKFLNSYQDQDVRFALGPLRSVAEKYDTAALFIGHFRKGSSGRAAERVLGSTAFVALARCNWMVMEETRDDVPTGRLLFAKAKQNIGEPVGAVAYRIESVVLDGGFKTSRIVWDGVVAGSADDLLRPAASSKGGKLEAAMLFLEPTLSRGRMRAKEVYDLAESMGHSEKTLNRAKNKLGVVTYQEPGTGTWYWEMPEESTETE